MSTELSQTDDYRPRLKEAAEARDDGEPERSAAIFDDLLGRFPGHADITVEYVQTLRKLGRLQQADQALDRSIEQNPDHFQLRRTWAYLPTHRIDHEEFQRRARILRDLFPPTEYPAAWHSLSLELDALYESGQWNRLADCVDEYWDDFATTQAILPSAIEALNKLFLTDRLAALADMATPQAWQSLPPETAGNVALRAEFARQNQTLLSRTGVKIVSIGQNCLPYLLGGRWGLIAPRADAGALTPFDLGGFRNDTAAEAIASGFASFDDPARYTVKNWGGPDILSHQPTGIDFFHERGPYWVTPDRGRFLARIASMISVWDRTKQTGKCVFVFCYCGAGSLDRLVEVAEKHLLGTDSHLLIIDVLNQPHDCPEHARVSYRHVPYPTDYNWIGIAHQNTLRGMEFEMGVVNAMTDAIIRFGSEHAAEFIAARRDALRMAAQKARARGHLEMANLLLVTSTDQLPGDAATAIEQAQLLQSLKRLGEADAVLTKAIEHSPDDFALCKAWADLPLQSADFDECIDRGQALRTRFPPQAQPQAWASLNTELTSFHAAGRWAEAAPFVRRNWGSFTTRPELLVSALDMLGGRLFRHADARDLLDAATPQALFGLSVETVATLRQQLDRASANETLLRNAGVRVMSLGPNALPFTLAGRWGLTGGPAEFDTLTPFDIAEFPTSAMARAIETDFSEYADHDRFVATPAWYGGSMLVHQPTATIFFSHRRARWLHDDRQRFFAHWDRMLANWRRNKSHDSRIYLLHVSGQLDLDRITEVLSAHLLGPQARLVVVDTRAPGASFTARDFVTRITAPPPAGYPWNRLTACAVPTVLDYEAAIVASIMEQIALLPRPSLLGKLARGLWSSVFMRAG